MKTHSEEYKFNCKYCSSAFMNRNVMVSHQKTCHLNSESVAGSVTLVQPQPVPVVSNLIIQPPPEKRFKVVLNSDEIKNLIRAKDEEIRKQEEANRNRMKLVTPPMVTIPASVLAAQDSPDIKDEPMEDDDAGGGDTFDEDDDDMDDVDDEGVDPLEQSLKPIVKPVVRKRAPVFPFEVQKYPQFFLCCFRCFRLYLISFCGMTKLC